MKQLQDILQQIPRSALILGIPAAVLLVVGYTVVFGSGGSSDDGGGKTRADAVLSDAAPTSTRAPAAATPRPSATAVNRADCNAIRGSDYKSPEERDWFQKNCGANSGGGTNTGTTARAAGPPSAGVQLATGSRLRIPGTSVDVDIYSQTVGLDAGALPDPTCYFCAVEYNLNAFGLGNRKVLAGHVDCATCHNGSSGAAAFWDLTRGSVGPGMEIKYASGGTEYTFVITAVGSFSPSDDVVALARGADMTLITCGGTWDPVAHEYSTRTFVFANLVS
ncbi:MAG TPA: class F sortase [Dehalococcoidia bacterium]|nr:class F sortase [Dehalococcoidia bacterium]